MAPNYDNTMLEPSLFPVRYPAVLVNSNFGLAVSMASNICSFNLSEICETTIALMKDPEHDALSTLKGPDFPGGGYIAEFILCSLFFPDRMAVAYPIAVTIGNLVDPPATMVNAAGDYAASFLVARITEGSGWLERTDGERAA